MFLIPFEFLRLFLARSSVITVLYLAYHRFELSISPNAVNDKTINIFEIKAQLFVHILKRLRRPFSNFVMVSIALSLCKSVFATSPRSLRISRFCGSSTTLFIQVTAANLRPFVIFLRDSHNGLGTELHRLGVICTHVLQMGFPIPTPRFVCIRVVQKIFNR